jgi:hypothetical protein
MDGVGWSEGRCHCVGEGHYLFDECVLLCVGGGECGVLEGELEEDVLVGHTGKADELLGIVAGGTFIGLVHTGEAVVRTRKTLPIDGTPLIFLQKVSWFACEAVCLKLASETTV